MLCNLIVGIASGILMVGLMMTKYVNKFCWLQNCGLGLLLIIQLYNALEMTVLFMKWLMV